MWDPLKQVLELQTYSRHNKPADNQRIGNQ